MTDAFDDAFASSRPIDSTTAPRRGTEWLEVPGQAYFGVVGSRMRKLGWAVLRQDGDGRRLPSIIAGERIKWKQYQTTPPSQEITDRRIPVKRRQSLSETAHMVGHTQQSYLPHQPTGRECCFLPKQRCLQNTRDGTALIFPKNNDVSTIEKQKYSVPTSVVYAIKVAVDFVYR